jgi:hypothetical protein
MLDTAVGERRRFIAETVVGLSFWSEWTSRRQPNDLQEESVGELLRLCSATTELHLYTDVSSEMDAVLELPVERLWIDMEAVFPDGPTIGQVQALLPSVTYLDVLLSHFAWHDLSWIGGLAGMQGLQHLTLRYDWVHVPDVEDVRGVVKDLASLSRLDTLVIAVQGMKRNKSAADRLTKELLEWGEGPPRIVVSIYQGAAKDPLLRFHHL